MAETFEEHLRALEEDVRVLESGETGLSESLGVYERAIAHLRACHEILAGMERRVKILTEDANGNLVEKDFASAEE